MKIFDFYKNKFFQVFFLNAIIFFSRLEQRRTRLKSQQDVTKTAEDEERRGERARDKVREQSENG
jgi:hypothetical protein